MVWRMHDPHIQICTFPTYKFQCWAEKKRWIPKRLAHLTLFHLWHKDPERKGRDDSCGWFKRAYHGDEKVLEKIVKRFTFDWDGTYKSEAGHVYFTGLFCPNGEPRLSVSGITINLFFAAAFEVFGHNRSKAMRFINRNMAELLIFSENTVDSLHDSITLKWGNDVKREERIRNMASCIYGWILRDIRPWYRHPRWHVHHWQFQFPLWQWFKRAFIERCHYCGKGFKGRDCVVTNYGGHDVWHDGCGPSQSKPQP